MELEIKPHKERWIILAALCLLELLLYFNGIYTGCSYPALSNDSTFVNITGDVISSHSWSHDVISLLSSPTLAWLVFRKLIGFRKMFVAASLLLFANYAVSFVCMLVPNVYALYEIGKTVRVLVKVTLSALKAPLSVLWFPETQVGLAIGVSELGSLGGKAFAYSVFPTFFPNETSRTNSSLFMETNFILLNFTNFFEISLSSRPALMEKVLFFGSALMSLFVFIFSFCFVKDLPSSPPSASQHEARNEQESDQKLHFTEYASASKDIICNIVVVFYSIAFAFLYYSLLLVEYLLYRVIFLESKEIQTQDNESNMLFSFTISVYLLGAIIGNIVSGKFLDSYKQYKLQAAFGAALSVVFSLLLLLGYFLKKLRLVCVAMFLMGSSSRISMVPLLDALLQHNHPTNALFVSNWLSFLLNLQALIIVPIGRFFCDHFGSLSLLMLHISTMLFSFVMCLCAKPHLKRLNSNNNEKISEKTQLLGDKLLKQKPNRQIAVFDLALILLQIRQ